jgi:AhpD family alkylhydroperoxidase
VTLVRLIDPSEADASVRPALERVATQYGAVLNTWRALLHRPEIFDAYLPYLRAVAGPGVVDQRVKDLAALAVAVASHCRYSVSHRVRAARAAGVTDAELDAVARWDLDAFAPRERLAMELARELTVAPPAVSHAANPQAVAPDLLARLRDQFNDPEIVELVADVSLWNALTRFHRIMGFQLDMHPPPPSLDAAT